MPSVKLWILYSLPEGDCKKSLRVWTTKILSDHIVRPAWLGKMSRLRVGTGAKSQLLLNSGAPHQWHAQAPDCPQHEEP